MVVVWVWTRGLASYEAMMVEEIEVIGNEVKKNMKKIG